MEFGSEHKRKRWYVAVVGGMVGASGLATAGVVTIIAPSTGPASAAEQTVARSAADGGSKDDGKKDDGKKDDGKKDDGKKDDGKKDDGKKDDGKKDDDKRKDVKKIGCDPDELIAALVRANADGGAKLELEPKCTYTLTAFDEGDTGFENELSGLPQIVERVKIDGNGAKIVRAANAEPFRIFNVGVGGDLTLRDLTLKGGDARETELGGGALLVQEGGRATVEDSKLTLNRSDSFGGAITNLGITKISGEDKSEKDDDQKDDPKKDDYGKDGSKKDDHREDGSEITNNSAVLDGGAIANVGALSVEKTRVSRNDAENGGALATFAGVAKVTKSEVDHNQALEDGGAVFAEGDGTIMQVKESYVHDNTAGEDGGAFFSEGSQFFVERSKVVHNTAGDDGGAAINNFGEFVVEKSKLNENKAIGGVAGGFGNAGEAVLRNSEVNENTAFAPFSEFSGFGGGIVNVDEGTLRLTKTDVIENASTEAPGGVFNDVEDGVLVDDKSTIIKNRPTNCAGSPEDVPNCFG
ncbi:hypothetical protein [Actinopolymorpha pittospori]|uniref:Polymorphic outer membrane protein repeat-containing protein n=1 Tax=Actinopolymorpha pittospori TaxID=648752 RepID=A0A927NAF4_9ACTN|nr:hypothetical protein [Actinopolymorpha pittospori]MBE1613183.1 hypothetical protein [Actinopolymorpha pittospori]